MPDHPRPPSGQRGAVTGSRQSKTCASCGRQISWRRAWERDWEQVRYCSQSCRARRVTDSDRALERVILDLLAARPRGATICPSEAARAVGGADEALWRPLMEPARAAARRLVAGGQVEITQGGRVVDPSTARGPVRVRRVTRG
ncbi:MAG: DUF3253 domain-containing protein [Cellulomonas sp.]